MTFLNAMLSEKYFIKVTLNRRKIDNYDNYDYYIIIIYIIIIIVLIIITVFPINKYI